MEIVDDPSLRLKGKKQKEPKQNPIMIRETNTKAKQTIDRPFVKSIASLMMSQWGHLTSFAVFRRAVNAI